jgi:hypothetical protein
MDTDAEGETAKAERAESDETLCAMGGTGQPRRSATLEHFLAANEHE